MFCGVGSVTQWENRALSRFFLLTDSLLIIVYFGQPSRGFFFAGDFFRAACQLPLILSLSGLGPGAALAFAGDFCFAAVRYHPL